MNISILGKVRCMIALGVMLIGSASCVEINETLGEDFIPTDQIWDVYSCKAEKLHQITMEKSDKLSGYSTTRFTFGATRDDRFINSKSTSFTLVPLDKSIDFGKEENGYPIVTQFHLSAERDTLSMVYDYQEKILQNVYVRSLKEPLDSDVLYSDTVLESTDNLITSGIPIYDGGDSLSFDFSLEYAYAVIKGIKDFQSEEKDTLSYYLKHVPGIVISTDPQTEKGGRINMFNLPLNTESGYITGNYAELKIKGLYDYSDEPVDTSFVFYFGPSDFLKEDDTSYPTQYAFNSNTNEIIGQTYDEFIEAWDGEKIYIEGGSGLKPVIKAREIRSIVSKLLKQTKDTEEHANIDTNTVVINKATIILPYNVGTSYDKLDKYPMMLSPTVRLTSKAEDDGEVLYTYAGLTDSSIESEDQGNINRSLNMYSPDISHHVQEIVNLKQEKDETDEDFAARVSKYDIWMLIIHEEITETNNSSSYDDYYNNLMYNSYYNNMMYDPYGYGYGYGGYYGGYGYGYDSYGYNNYYNYYMMAAYASASSSSSTTSSMELDKDRFYNAELNGPASSGDKPSLKITFSALREAE